MFSKHIPLLFTLSPQNCVKMRNLPSYNVEKGIMEYIRKKISTKNTKMHFLVKVETKKIIYVDISWDGTSSMMCVTLDILRVFLTN